MPRHQPIIQLEMQDPNSDPYRRGIYRPNAQRLSLSLGPLVAQRSLLFRIRADLAGAGAAGRTVQTYEEVDEQQDSALLYSISPSASARLLSSKPMLSAMISAALATKPLSGFSIASALSSGSVYSQDSWRPTSSTFSPVNTQVQAPAVRPMMKESWRRRAIAFSPSVQWDEFSLDSAKKADVSARRRLALPAPVATPKTPLSARLRMNVVAAERREERQTERKEIRVPSTAAAGTRKIGAVRMAAEPSPVVVVRRRVEAPSKSAAQPRFPPTSQATKTSVQPPRQRDVPPMQFVPRTSEEAELLTRRLQKKKKEPKPSKDTAEDKDGEDHATKAAKRMSKSSKAIGKVMGRLSMPSTAKKDSTTKDVKRKTNIVHPMDLKLQLPDLQLSPVGLYNLIPDPLPVQRSSNPNANASDTTFQPRPFPRTPTASTRERDGYSTATTAMTDRRPITKSVLPPIPPLPSSVERVGPRARSTTLPAPRTPSTGLGPHFQFPATPAPPMPPLPGHSSRNQSRPPRTPHEAPPSTPFRPLTPSETVEHERRKSHMRSKSSPAASQFDFKNLPRDAVPPLPPMPRLAPQNQVKPSSSSSNPNKASKDPEQAPARPRPPRSRPPAEASLVRSQSQPRSVLRREGEAERRREQMRQAERWEEIIATTPVSARSRGRSFSSSGASTISTSTTSSIRSLGTRAVEPVFPVRQLHRPLRV